MNLVLNNEMLKDFSRKSNFFSPDGMTLKHFYNKCKKYKNKPDLTCKNVEKNGKLDETDLLNELNATKIPWLFLKVKFTLARPYFSKGDESCYYINNPIAKEHIYKLPIIKASSWKGLLRWAAIKELVYKMCNQKTAINDYIKERLALIRLFGNENKVETRYLDKFFSELNILSTYVKELSKITRDEDEMVSVKGSLNFFNSYFTSIGYEMINKLNDTTRKGIGPIYYEVVPKGEKGEFVMVYTPIGRIFSENEAQYEINLVLQALKKIFYIYGFSAKGEHWGIIEKLSSGDIEIHENKLPFDKKVKEDLKKILIGGEECE